MNPRRAHFRTTSPQASIALASVFATAVLMAALGALFDADWAARQRAPATTASAQALPHHVVHLPSVHELETHAVLQAAELVATPIADPTNRPVTAQRETRAIYAAR